MRPHLSKWGNQSIKEQTSRFSVSRKLSTAFNPAGGHNHNIEYKTMIYRERARVLGSIGRNAPVCIITRTGPSTLSSWRTCAVKGGSDDSRKSNPFERNR